MSSSKAQKIVVFIELKESDSSLIAEGIKLASLFKKELCLAYNAKNNNSLALEQKIEKHIASLELPTQEEKITTLIFSEKWVNTAVTLANKYEAILMLANSEGFKCYSAVLQQSPIPLLFIHPSSRITNFNQLVHSMDSRKENSDCSLWCSYFGRFNNAEIVVVAANERKAMQNKLARNIKLSRKLYQQFKISHKVYKGTKSRLNNTLEALDLALASDCNLFIMLGSSTITLLDMLLGLPEEKIVKKAGRLPVLIVNPKVDNYVLCD